MATWLSYQGLLSLQPLSRLFPLRQEKCSISLTSSLAQRPLVFGEPCKSHRALVVLTANRLFVAQGLPEIGFLF